MLCAKQYSADGYNNLGLVAYVKGVVLSWDGSSTRMHEGTGLGLSLSHDIIVKQHSGSIDVETEAGSFTEFIITLPRQATDKKKTGSPV